MTCKLRSLLALPFTLALLPAAPAFAQSQPNDVRCLLLSNIYAEQGKDEKARAIALQASFFYLGRISGSVASVQARLDEEAKTLSSSESADAMAACANAMVKRVAELSGAGQPKTASPPGR